MRDIHGIDKITTAELLQNVTILKQCNNKRELMFYEALFIKSLKPTLNSQTEFSDKLLKIFKH